MTEHTKGPWEILPINSPEFRRDPHNIQNWKPDGFLIVRPSDDPKKEAMLIAEVGVGGSSPELSEAERNVNLMAAAPVLLEALYEALPFVNDDLGAYKKGYVAGVEEKIRAAIARAEGREV